jgi:hypothetical protein
MSSERTGTSESVQGDFPDWLTFHRVDDFTSVSFLHLFRRDTLVKDITLNSQVRLSVVGNGLQEGTRTALDARSQ